MLEVPSPAMSTTNRLRASGGSEAREQGAENAEEQQVALTEAAPCHISTATTCKEACDIFSAVTTDTLLRRVRRRNTLVF